jgi:hypothetical protein
MSSTAIQSSPVKFMARAFVVSNNTASSFAKTSGLILPDLVKVHQIDLIDML